MTELYLILYLSDKGETYLIFIEESRPNCMEKHIWLCIDVVRPNCILNFEYVTNYAIYENALNREW